MAPTEASHERGLPSNYPLSPAHSRVMPLAERLQAARRGARGLAVALYGQMKAEDITTDGPWYGAKCVFLHRDAPRQGAGQVFEERIVLLRASSPTEAVQRAEAEAKKYARQN